MTTGNSSYGGGGALFHVVHKSEMPLNAVVADNDSGWLFVAGEDESLYYAHL